MFQLKSCCAVMLALLAAYTGSSVRAEDAVDFVRDVRPIFQKHCYSCHADEKQKSGLRLDIKSEAFKGGEAYGPSIISKNAADSPLIQFVADPDADMIMPPESDRLSPQEIAILTRWVQEGAVWPDGVDLAVLENRLDHWSYKPVRNPDVPKPGSDNWSRNDVDRFILHRLQKNGFAPAPEVDRISWLRRITFDLIGLPPSPTDIDSFLNDNTQDAYSSVVDRLLASPRYGERWAQHWLDVVRYADTHGFEVNTERPNAWPYRDYVIDAFNKDTPYDQFVREQIVGDATGQDAATGFLVTASVLLPGQIGQDDASKRLARQDSLDEIVVNIGQTFLGLSIGCARCHDHKFDPITQHEYYSMQAFVAGVEYGDRPLNTTDAVAQREKAKQARGEIEKIEQQLQRLTPAAMSGVQRTPVNAEHNTDRFVPVITNKLRFTINATNKYEPCIDEIEVFNADAKNIALASNGATVRSSGDTVVAGNHELKFVNDGQYGNGSSWMSGETGKGWLELEFPTSQKIERVVWGRDRLKKYADRLATDYRIEVMNASGKWKTVADSTDRLPYAAGQKRSPQFSTDGLVAEEKAAAEKLMLAKKSLESKVAAATSRQVAFAGKFRKPDDIHVLHRGDPEQPKDRVRPTVLSAIGELELPTESNDRQRRTALAEWMASSGNLLTARVMVNRIWQGHFGRGIVGTASDFGRTGAQPSHPDLLDWLATNFVASGWSVKDMHRLIVLSATYRQSGRFDEAAAAVDSDSRLLWRFPSRRLDAETIRDSMLFVSGQLNLKTGGPGFNLFDKRGGLTGFKPVESFTGDGLRRMIYAHKVRRERDAVFGAFDCPDNGQSTSRRRESATPIQALNLFNSRFSIDRANAFAKRIIAEAGDNVARQIDSAYELSLSRLPGPEEAAEARLAVENHGLATLCRVLLNSNEFLFLP